MPDDFQPPNDPPVRSTECSATTWERQYLGKWESLSWQKIGVACYYTHRTTKQELPARIVELEYEHGRGRARCEIMDVSGRLRVRWMDTHELHQSPNNQAHPQPAAAVVERKGDNQ